MPGLFDVLPVSHFVHVDCLAVHSSTIRIMVSAKSCADSCDVRMNSRAASWARRAAWC